MVYVYGINISKFPDPLEEPDIMMGLPEERKRKILSYKQKEKRLQSVGAGWLLKRVLNRHAVSTETLRTEASGKPIVDGICFNLSHSGDIVICAVGQQSVGCDIEKLKDAPKTVGRMFSAEERESLQQLAGEGYNREFIRLWTRKESYLKMTGVGIRVPLDKLEMNDCYIKEYTLPMYQIAVCAKEDVFSELIWEEF